MALMLAEISYWFFGVKSNTNHLYESPSIAIFRRTLHTIEMFDDVKSNNAMTFDWKSEGF